MTIKINFKNLLSSISILISSILIIRVKSTDEDNFYSKIFNESPFETEYFLDKFNQTYFKEICSDYTVECYDYASIFKNFKLINPDNIGFQYNLINQASDDTPANKDQENLVENISTSINKNLKEQQIKYNKLLSDVIFKLAEFDYYGVIEGKPNLYDGIRGFIISGFVGNPNAMYKLYIVLELDIIAFYYKRLQESLLNKDDPLLHFILVKNNFCNNFYFEDKYEKQTLANLFLYTSSLHKIPSAINTMGNKYKKGYGFEKSCENSIEYFREQSYATVEEHYKINKPQFLEKTNIASSEYVGLKYSGVETIHITQILEYYELEAKKGLITFISQLGHRYLFGQETPQDFSKARQYFEQGMQLNDTTSMYYLGEIYLNGWGVEKNYTKAYEMFKASESNSKSINTLGYMYYYGYGVEKNVKRAYDLFQSKNNFNYIIFRGN